MAAIKISTLPPLLGLSINQNNYIPIIIPVVGTTRFTTVKATSLQVASFIQSTITNQSLSTTSDVIFNSISGVEISAVNLYGDGSHITNVFNQSLNTINSVIFNSVSTNTLSCKTLSTTEIFINGNQSVSKYTDTINHTGGPTPVLYTINHPFVSEDVMMQLFERKIQPGGLVQLEVVIASIVNITNGVNGIVAVSINNLNNATYKIMLIG